MVCVDDDLSLLCLYHDELIEEGYKVILAKDGIEALMKFEKESPDIVVLDIRMPGMDGIETLTAMLGRPPDSGGLKHGLSPVPGKLHDLRGRGIRDQIF